MSINVRSIAVYYECGDVVYTNINGTDQEILDYYVKKTFNLGDGRGGDRMERAIFVDFIDTSIEKRQRRALEFVMTLMCVNDTTKDKNSPWIPGKDAKCLKKLVANLVKQ